MAPVCIHCGRPKPGDQPKKIETLPPPKKKPRPDVMLGLTGGALLAGGLVCLVAGYPGYAGVGLLAGLCGVAAGSFWSWLRRE